MINIIKEGERCGFQMTFKNGWTVSIQIGRGNYCDNRHKSSDFSKCENAEIAAVDKNGEWYKFDYDSVQGYVSTDDIAKFILMVCEFAGDAEAINSIREVHDGQ